MNFKLYHITDDDAEDTIIEDYCTLPEVRDFLYDFWHDSGEHFDSQKAHKDFLHSIKFGDELSLGNKLGGIGYSLFTIDEPRTVKERAIFDEAKKRMMQDV